MSRKLSPFWLLVVLTGLNLLNYVDRFILNALRTPIADEFHADYATSAWAFSAFMIGYMLTAPFFGYLGDRGSRKWLIALGIFVWSLGTVLTGFAGGFGMLLFYRVLVGVGEASYATISPILIADSWKRATRNNALTIFYVATPVGAAIGYVLGGEIGALWGWRHAFIWVGAPGLILALILLPFRDPERGESDTASEESGAPDAAVGPSADAHAKPRPRDVLKLFGIVNYNLVVWGYVAYTFALGAFAFWGPTFFEKVHHLSTQQADRFFGGVILIGGLVGTLLGGFAATWWHQRNPAAYAWVLTGSLLLAAPLAFVALQTTSATTAMGFLGASIFLLFLCTGPVNTLIIESVPITLRSSAMAISLLLIHLFGDMPSPWVVGKLADRMDSLQKAVLILPAMLIAGAGLWLALALRTARPIGGGRRYRK